MEALLPAFYNEELLEGANAERVISWIRSWLSVASKQGVKSPDVMVTLMRNNSPKYVPREWMLIDAYKKANEGDYTVVQELYDLFKQPYRIAVDDKEKYFKKYFRKAPQCTYDGIGIGGEAYMT